jgi:poly-gamma-glutamate synthesis protein (capsule biosynthesis protein)
MAETTLFLCGDVMLGRGIDQILPHPANPTLYEPYVRSAEDYIRLAERATGPIPRPVGFGYIWGYALDELERRSPDVRIINLETSITDSHNYWMGKGVHYKMNPANIACITAAGIDCCALANNHVLDWGYQGLADTLDNLREANLKYSGAGMNLEEAQAPAVVKNRDGRVIVFALGSPTSGIPPGWVAGEDWPGVNLLSDFSEDTVRNLNERVGSVKRRGDVIVASIHWGANWGFEIAAGQVAFAHRLIDGAVIDVINGHSSHHVKGIEVYKNKPIIYGCGDFLNDYEGIDGYESFRGDLGLMYFVTMDILEGVLISLLMSPTRIKHFRVNKAAPEETAWLEHTLNRTGSEFGTAVEKTEDVLKLRWHPI